MKMSIMNIHFSSYVKIFFSVEMTICEFKLILIPKKIKLWRTFSSLIFWNYRIELFDIILHNYNYSI